MKVMIAADQPLIVSFWVPRVGKDPLLITYKYERLLEFFFYYGKLGHSFLFCFVDTTMIKTVYKLSVKTLLFGV